MTTLSCPNVLATGTCDNRTCTFIHNMFTCDSCGLVFQSPNECDLHLQSKKHRLRAQGETIVYYCPICEANVTGHKGWKQHTQGRSHQRKANNAGVPVEVAPQPAISTASATACDLCQVVLPNHVWNQHLSSPRHQSHEQFSRYMTAVEQSETDKNGVVVEGSFDFDFIDPAAAKKGKELTATIKGSSKSVLSEAKLASAQGKSGGVSS
jgi:helicase MOV-10